MAKDLVRKSGISIVPSGRCAQTEETSRSQCNTLLAGHKRARNTWSEMDEASPEAARDTCVY